MRLHVNAPAYVNLKSQVRSPRIIIGQRPINDIVIAVFVQQSKGFKVKDGVNLKLIPKWDND